LLSVVHLQKKVKVVGEKRETTAADAVEPLGAAKDS
jgi:hypothetical protein